MAKTNDIKENFSALLRDSLRSRFGKIPSAAVFAREFNLRAYDTSPISQESARRWLRGVSLPEEARLRVLVNWLNLNFNDALKPGRIHSYRTVAQPSAVREEAPVTSPPARTELFTGASRSVTPRSLPNGSALTDQDAALLSAVFKLTEEQRSAILGLIAATGSGSEAPQLGIATLQPDARASASPSATAEDAMRSLRTRP